MSKGTSSTDLHQRIHEASVTQILRLPRDLRETVVAVLSNGDLTVEQLSAMTLQDVEECQRRLDELVRLGHLEGWVFSDQVFYRATHGTRAHKRRIGALF